MFNYDASQVGVPYVRVDNLVIQYPKSGLPFVTLEQTKCVKLSDGTIAQIDVMPSISFPVDLIANANTPIPIVNPANGAALGPSTTLQGTMLSILAIVRQQQLLLNV